MIIPHGTIQIGDTNIYDEIAQHQFMYPDVISVRHMLYLINKACRSNRL